MTNDDAVTIGGGVLLICLTVVYLIAQMQV